MHSRLRWSTLSSLSATSMYLFALPCLLTMMSAAAAPTSPAGLVPPGCAPSKQWGGRGQARPTRRKGGVAGGHAAAHPVCPSTLVARTHAALCHVDRRAALQLDTGTLVRGTDVLTFCKAAHWHSLPGFKLPLSCHALPAATPRQRREQHALQLSTLRALLKDLWRAACVP